MTSESFEVVCSDGWRLRGEVRVPSSPRAVAVLGHAMMVDRRTLDRPRGRGLASTLVERGLAVVIADLRGHGESGPRAHEGGRWCYDDIVENDVPALLGFAREKFSLPVASVGHSLFAHATVAYLTRHPDAPLDKLVLLAANFVRREWPLIGTLEKGALITAMAALTRVFGRFPSRLIGFGSDDEAAAYVDDFMRGLLRGDWRARDGFSYAAARGRVTTPTLQIAGAGDRFFCRPEEARSMIAPMPNARLEIVGRRSGLAFDPGHMDLVLDERMRPAWQRVADFVLQQ